MDITISFRKEQLNFTITMCHCLYSDEYLALDSFTFSKPEKVLETRVFLSTKN